jgi:anti-sigma regulatory factor (Ser/Thr protein kinase)
MHQELVLLGASADIAIEALTWTEAACARAGIQAHRAERIATAVVEAVNNSIEHGYAQRAGSVGVALDTFADRIEISVSDQGQGLPRTPATECPAPDAPRGRGSWIMRQCCDAVRHEFPEGEQRVVLVLMNAFPQLSSAGAAR